MSDQTSKQDYIRNPEGRGGFQDRPQDISRDGRPKNAESFSYWMNYFKTLGGKEFKEYPSKHPEMTMAAIAAYARVSGMVNHLDEFNVVANRTEGMPTQAVDMNVKGKIEIEFTHETEATRQTDGNI